MNTTIKKVFAAAALAFMVTGCSTECSYADFKAAYDEAVGTYKNVELQSIKIKGTLEGKDFNFTYSDDSNPTADETLCFAAFMTYSGLGHGYAGVESKSATYFKGSPLAIEVKDNTLNKEYRFEFDAKYAYVSRVVEGKDTDLKATYNFK